VNIALTPGVNGKVTINLYDVTLRQAIHAIAEAAGYSVEERARGYLIRDEGDGSRRSAMETREVRALRVQYSNPQLVAGIIRKYVSREGSVTLLEERSTLAVEDNADNLARIERLLREVDRQPQQIMIEAKILEGTLDSSQNFGIDWTRIFSANGVNRGGIKGLASPQAPGLFFNFVNNNIEIYLNAHRCSSGR
jgi:type II secretory pathway component GspD/PulD (secretin)